MESSLIFSLILIGFSAVVGQIVLIRELLVLFYGNELSTAIIIASWLFWTSLGSLILGRISDSILSKRRTFALTQLLISFLLPLSILLVRVSRIIWAIPPGEILDLLKMVEITFFALSSFCFFSGFLFSLGCALYGEVKGERFRSPGAVYLLEAIGSGAGGVIFTFIFVHRINHLQISILVSLFLIFSSMFLLVCGQARGKIHLGIYGIYITLGGLIFIFILNGDRLDMMTRKWVWRGYHLVHSEDTPYGNITVLESEGQLNFYENGLWIFSSPDPRSSEESVHFAMLQHPCPERVLLIGGGISNSLSEILKHPSVRFVDYVELDPRIISAARKILSKDRLKGLDDERVKIVHTDGRKYIRSTESLYDVIIVNLPDPMTAQINRFYTVDFFRNMRRIAHQGGIVALKLSSSEDVIGDTLAMLLRSLYLSMSEAFEDVLVLPGHVAQFFGSMDKGILVSDPLVLMKRIKERGIRLMYVREYYIPFSLSQERRSYIQEILSRPWETRINRDMNPSCYFYDLIHWSAQYTPWLKDIFLFMGKVGMKWFIICGAIFTFLSLLLSVKKKGKGGENPIILWSCFITGCSEITMSILLILAFQVLYGYVYYELSILITAYMIGLVMGSAVMLHFLQRTKRQVWILISIQAGLAIYSIFLLLVILFLHQLPPSSILSTAMEVGFPVLALIAGFFGGLHFPLVNRLYWRKEGEVGRSAGLIYGFDLIGSAGGAILAGVFLLPVLGIPDTLYVIAAVNLFTAFSLLYLPRVISPLHP